MIVTSLEALLIKMCVILFQKIKTAFKKGLD